MGMNNFTVYESPLGPLTLTGDKAGLTGLWFPGRGPAADEADHRDRRDVPFVDAIGQLDEYFSGARRDFELTLAPGGTAFQRRVWAALQEIAYGATTTYGAIADQLGAERGEWVSPRAVGCANGANPISIIVPCHRVIGSDGSLTGYGGGLHRKQALLEHELAGAVRGAGGHAPPPGRAHRQMALL